MTGVVLILISESAAAFIEEKRTLIELVDPGFSAARLDTNSRKLSGR